MRILLADETNNDPNDEIKFFIYGGTIFNSSSVMSIGDSVKELRAKFGLEQTDKIKFNLKSCPKGLSREDHTELKNQIIELAIENNVTLIINCVLHDIAKNKEKSDLQEMTSRTVFRRFNDLCAENKEAGLVLADRWPCENGFQFLEACQHGKITYSSGESVSLPWIHGYAQVSDNSTTLMCVSDVLLGAFRYCINNRDKDIVNRTLMPKVANLLWHDTNQEGQRVIWNKGLSTSPRNITSPTYKKEYDSLTDHIIEYANYKD